MQKRCLGMYRDMWGCMGIAGRRCKFFCGDEKYEIFCVGNAWGRPHANFCAWGHPHAFPTQNISFFSSPQKNLHHLPAIPMHSHISLYIPMYLFCMGMCGNSQFTSNICCPHAKFHHLVVPTQTTVIGTRPHAKFPPSVGL